MFRTMRLQSCILASLILTSFGCKPEPPPIREAQKLEDPTQSPRQLSGPTQPKSSDPAAVAILEAALQAHSQGNPTKLDTLKTCTITRSGLLGLSGTNVSAQFITDLAYPDSFKVRTELVLNPPIVSFFAITPTRSWQALPGSGQSATTEGREKEDLTEAAKLDLKLQLWEDSFSLLFPLRDPKVLVTKAENQTILGQPAEGLHIWTADGTYALAHFDQKTHLLCRFIYQGSEQGKPVTKEWLALSQGEVAGFQLATKSGLKANGIDIANWQKFKLEVKASFPAEHFQLAK